MKKKKKRMHCDEDFKRIISGLIWKYTFPLNIPNMYYWSVLTERALSSLPHAATNLALHFSTHIVSCGPFLARRASEIPTYFSSDQTQKRKTNSWRPSHPPPTVHPQDALDPPSAVWRIDGAPWPFAPIRHWRAKLIDRLDVFANGQDDVLSEWLRGSERQQQRAREKHQTPAFPVR